MTFYTRSRAIPFIVFPQTIDNNYRGHRIALWLFVPLVLLNLGIGFNSIFFTHMVASSADGIPLDSFPPLAAQTVVKLFALLGLSRLMIALLCILIFVRYRAMIAFMYIVLLLQHLGGKFIIFYNSSPSVGTLTANIVNTLLVTLMVLGLILSLWRSHDR